MRYALPKGQATAADIDRDAEAVQRDMTDDALVARAFETFDDRLSKLNVLINDAGATAAS